MHLISWINAHIVALLIKATTHEILYEFSLVILNYYSLMNATNM